MMKHLLVLPVLLATSAAHAASVEIPCPSRIQTRQQAEIPRNWQSFIDTANTHHRLSGVDLYDGPPEQLALLKPDNADTDDTAPPYWTTMGSNNLYVVCSYTQTGVRLARKIDLAPERCTVTQYDREPKGISCE